MADTHEVEAPDAPVSNSTLEQLSELWDSVKEVSPESGEMPASFRDFMDAEADAQVVEESSQAFDRLVSLHSKKQSIVDLFDGEKHPVLTNSAGVMATGAMLYTMVNHLVQGPDHFDLAQQSFPEAFKDDPATGVTMLGMMAGLAGAAVVDVMDRGYAAFQGLGDALHRLNDEAIPKAESLNDRLSLSEGEVYGDVLKMGYQLTAGTDEITQQQFLSKIRDSVATVTNKVEGTPNAGAIQDVLDSLHESLSDAMLNDPDLEAANAEMDEPTTPTTTPSL